MPLKNLTILITRPAHQARSLCEQIEKIGGQTILLPTIEIIDPPNQKVILKAMQKLNEFDIAIFTSANAVNKIASFWPTQNKLTIFAVGPSTAAMLLQHKIKVNYVPKNNFSSEGLLELSELNQIKNKKIALFTGAGGRTLLLDTLQHRGAMVTKIETYQRQCPTSEAMKKLPINWQNKITLVISTSSENLQNLFNLFGENYRSWLQHIPLLVISPRMADIAKNLGCKGPLLIANNSTDKAILECLRTWYACV